MSESNGYATAQELFQGPSKRKFVDIEIEGLGKFRIRTLATSEAMALEQGDTKTTLLRVIVACCVDGEGNQVFSDSNIEDLKNLPASHIMALGNACNEFAGLTYNRDAVKNLSETQAADSR